MSLAQRLDPARPYSPGTAAPPASRPRLWVVRAQAPDARRAPFVGVCVAILVGALLAALALTTSMAATAYTMRDRQAELADLQQAELELASAVEAVSAPQAVMDRALALGLVPSEGTVYVNLDAGTLLGGQ